MIGFSLNPCPPMARKTVAGKFGGFLQVDADDARLMTSQVSVYGAYPPQMSSLDKPLNKIIIVFKIMYFSYVRLGFPFYPFCSSSTTFKPAKAGFL
jgi:hypothetical protein